MNKKQYAKILAERLVYILDENEKLENKKEQIAKKIQHYNMSVRDLTVKEREIYFYEGYSKMAFNRVRIELSKILLEIAKEN